MKSSNSYQINLISSNVELEINRLKAQVELFWPKEVRHYVEFGLMDGMQVVEFGSGPGFLTEKLLDSFPGLDITAVEIDPFLVEFAQKHLSGCNDERYRITHGSILEPDLPDNAFDFAITRLVLEHLPDPVKAVKEVFRVLKPGGKAVFVDNDFEMHIMTFPHIFELRELYDAYCQARYSEGGNPVIGRELPSVLKRGGFAKVDFEIITAHSDILGDEIFLKSEGLGIPSQLVRDGYLSSKALAKVSVGWRNMLKNQNHSILRQLYMAMGEKPGD